MRLSDTDGMALWAADVMGVGWNSRLGPAVDGIEAELESQLLPLAQRYQRGISVMFKPPIGHADKGTAYVATIVGYTSALLDGTAEDTDPLAIDPDTQILFSETPLTANETPVSLMYGLTDTVNSLEQLRGTLVAPLERKLSNQLRRAHELGYPTMLLLDREGGHPRFGGNWIASNQLIAQVVGETVVRHGHRTGTHVLDLAVVVQGDTCAPVYGYWPARPSP